MRLGRDFFMSRNVGGAARFLWRRFACVGEEGADQQDISFASLISPKMSILNPGYFDAIR